MANALGAMRSVRCVVVLFHLEHLAASSKSSCALKDESKAEGKFRRMPSGTRLAGLMQALPQRLPFIGPRAWQVPSLPFQPHQFRSGTLPERCFFGRTTGELRADAEFINLLP